METSTTAASDLNNSDATSTTTTDSQATDTKTADTIGNDLDTSKSDNTVDEKSETSNNDNSASKFDDDLNDWAAKRGMPKAESDEQLQAYQEVRNEQREFHRSRQDKQAAKDAQDLSREIDSAKSDIENDDDGTDDPLEKDVRDLKSTLQSERITRLQSEFYTENKVTTEEHNMILDVLKEKFARPTTDDGKLNAINVWSSPDALPDLLDIARSRIAKTQDTSMVANEAARKERERIARESQAKSPSRNASTTSTEGKTDDEARLERFKARYNKT